VELCVSGFLQRLSVKDRLSLNPPRGSPEGRAGLCGQVSSACRPSIICCCLLGCNQVRFHVSDPPFASSLHHWVTSRSWHTALSAPGEGWRRGWLWRYSPHRVSSAADWLAPAGPHLLFKGCLKLASLSASSPVVLHHRGVRFPLAEQGDRGVCIPRQPTAAHGAWAPLPRAAEWVGRERRPRLGRGFLLREGPVLVSQRTDSPEAAS